MQTDGEEDEMYKVASANRQSTLTRGTLADWQNGQEKDLTPEQQLTFLRNQFNTLAERLTAFTRRDPEYAPLRDNLVRVQSAIRELKAQLGIGKGPIRRGIEGFTIDVAKESMTSFQWAQIVKTARERFDKYEAEKPERNNAAH
jgi:hypothetical protein